MLRIMYTISEDALYPMYLIGEFYWMYLNLACATHIHIPNTLQLLIVELTYNLLAQNIVQRMTIQDPS